MKPAIRSVLCGISGVSTLHLLERRRPLAKGQLYRPRGTKIRVKCLGFRSRYIGIECWARYSAIMAACMKHEFDLVETNRLKNIYVSFFSVCRFLAPGEDHEFHFVSSY
jgi:hypothetical protein